MANLQFHGSHEKTRAVTSSCSCGQTDSLEHRLWRCPLSPAPRGKAICKVAAAIPEAGNLDDLLTKGLHWSADPPPEFCIQDAAFTFRLGRQDSHEPLHVRKVKAHRTFKQAQEDGDLPIWAGNEQADASARRACGPDALAHSDRARNVLARVGTSKAVLARANAVHAARRELDKVADVNGWQKGAHRATGKESGVPAPPGHRHALGWSISGFRCSRCLCYWKETPRPASRCAGFPERVSQLLEGVGRGHRLIMARWWDTACGEAVPGWIVFCSSCGLYFARRTRKLWAPCFGHAGTRTTFLKRMAELRLTPDGKSKLGDCWAVGSHSSMDLVRRPCGDVGSQQQAALEGLLVDLGEESAGQPEEVPYGLAGDLALLAVLETAAAEAAAGPPPPGGHEQGDDELGWWSGSEAC
jgi:hypothetical protein